MTLLPWDYFWIGFDKPKTITPGAAGGTLAAPIFGKMLAEYYGSRATTDWVAPPGLISAQLDRITGQLADSTTPPDRRYVEYFLSGTEPFPLRVSGWLLFKNGPILF